MKTVFAPDTLYKFEVKGDVIVTCWHESLSAESNEFRDSIKNLFRFAAERKLKKVLLDSGTPAGGTLTEELMLLVQNAILKIDLEKIAILESCDFHWDNNLLQFLKYLNTFLQLDLDIKLFNSKTLALVWLGAGKV